MFFLTVAWLQVAWALAVARRPSTLTYRLGIVLNAAVIAVWLVSRAIGIDGDKEAIASPMRWQRHSKRSSCSGRSGR